MTFRTRGYLPHIESPESIYFITLRLANTLPQHFLREIQAERNQLLNASKNKIPLTNYQKERLQHLESKKIHEYLDRGLGDCWLKDDRIATVVSEAIQFFDGKRYVSHVYCIMPNHLHWVVTVAESSELPLAKVIHGLKSFTAHKSNEILDKAGPFWNREYYDHRIGSEGEFERTVHYVVENPVKAGLCEDWKDWPWTKCSEGIKDALEVEGL